MAVCFKKKRDIIHLENRMSVRYIQIFLTPASKARPRGRLKIAENATRKLNLNRSVRMLIRQETTNDHNAVYNLIRDAFASAEHSDGTEQDLVEAL